MKRRIKAFVIGLALLFSVGAAGCGQQWAEAPAAVEPVAEHAFPLTGEALRALSAGFYDLCPVEKPRGPACLKVKDTLNKVIRAYTEANDMVLEAQ